MRKYAGAATVLALILGMPARAVAQSASIVGVVVDESGAALPGATIQVSSPALIERVRTTVATGDGRFQVVDLRPGEYIVTFELSGFQTVRRESIALSTAFTATVDATLPVGRVSEQIVVTGRRAGDRRAIGHVRASADTGAARRHSGRPRSERRGAARAGRGDGATRRRRIGDAARPLACRSTDRRRAIWCGTPTAST